MPETTRGHLPVVLISAGLASLFLVSVLVGCLDSGGRSSSSATLQSCMTCHNGSTENDYSGPGIENPHPFPAAPNLLCTTCHGGNPNGSDRITSHVPPPPEIGDRTQWLTDPTAYFNRLTLTGIDKFPDYQVNGITYTALDFLQFINPSDLRVVSQNRSCGQCHVPHVNAVTNSLLASEAGILSGAMYAIGVDNAVPENQGLYEDTAADMGFRAVTDPSFSLLTADIGDVGRLVEFPVFSVRGATGPLDIHNNPIYDSVNLPSGLNIDNTVITDSPLANLYHEQVAFTCGDCHLGSAGANNRYGDFRPSGCAACHMRSSLSGRNTSGDPNLSLTEPLDPDDIDEPELPHVRRHLIQSVAKTLTTGETVQGIDDYACAGCHQGSNRTVMQYWGIRLDQNQDVRNNDQYPIQPVSYQSTSGDTRLFDPVIGNNTFNGRNRNQYLRFEDYDGDGRDDTPADVHYDAGMGCIDCHGSFDLHGGNVLAGEDEVHSRMEQSVAIKCESCHGSIDAYAQTAPGTGYDGQAATLALDSKGNALRHVVLESDGNFYLYSRLTGNQHFIPQTMDTVVDNGALNPTTSQPIYTPAASYAMGRADGNAATGIGPQQVGGTLNGFTHTASMNCAACHSSWTNTCMGCHLEGEYNTGNNFSNITGERIVFREDNADFVYQSPVFFQLGVDEDNKITQVSPNTKVFFKWKDRTNTDSQVFAFTDRNGGGNNAGSGFGALGHNAMMAHSIRGKVDSANEGPRYCVACHLTDAGLATYGADYTAFRTAMAANDFGSLDFPLLQTHFGSNPGNQMNSPLWVHMVAGLGSGLFLFDQNGGPMNELDDNPNRVGANGVAPSTNFVPGNVAFNLDRIVETDGSSNGSSNHPMLAPGSGVLLRQGAANPNLSGPMGTNLIMRLIDQATGIVLDSWLDADGQTQGQASNYVN